MIESPELEQVAEIEREPRELVSEIERLLAELEGLRDPVAQQTATAVVQALLELYGTGIERLVEIVAEQDDGRLAAAFAGDELVAHLLLLHGLHPVPLLARVRGALDEVRPYLDSHGGGVELLSVEDATVRLALRGSCSGCPSSSMTLKLAIENAIHKAAPEIEEVIAEDATSPAPLLQIELAPALEGQWSMVGGLPELSSGGLLVKQVAGHELLFMRAADQLYGYRPACPACGESLERGLLSGFELSCESCGSRYDVLRAGRCLDSPQLHLEPVPLLVGDDGLVKVGLPVPA